MKLEMKVPSPGESITEVEIAQWLVSDGDFVALRPEKGMSASKINDIIGKKAKRDLKK